RHALTSQTAPRRRRSPVTGQRGLSIEAMRIAHALNRVCGSRSPVMKTVEAMKSDARKVDRPVCIEVNVHLPSPLPDITPLRRTVAGSAPVDARTSKKRAGRMLD